METRNGLTRFFDKQSWCSGQHKLRDVAGGKQRPCVFSREELITIKISSRGEAHRRTVNPEPLLRRVYHYGSTQRTETKRQNQKSSDRVGCTEETYIHKHIPFM